MIHDLYLRWVLWTFDILQVTTQLDKYMGHMTYDFEHIKG